MHTITHTPKYVWLYRFPIRGEDVHLRVHFCVPLLTPLAGIVQQRRCYPKVCAQPLAAGRLQIRLAVVRARDVIQSA